ncbi:hypothetical protein WKI68_37455 [Streptomyces sp. MS1.HAVA.3]|uniref:Uncharacterized protein n=1 Tax=Streptomyces caledonius TaxID=3134107 RepID=A0ABU8UBX9_9ACTN
MAATARLRARLISRVEPDGAVRDPCHSRVLESALLFALLERTRLEPAVRRRVAAYLTGHCDSPILLDRLLARSALGRREPAADVLDVERFLARAPSFTGARKRTFLHAVLLLLGAAPGTAWPGADAFDLRGLHTWARVQVTAVKAVLAHAHRLPHLIEAADLDLLVSTQRPGTVWEGNLLIHLSVLHALAPLPGYQQLVSGGIRTALEHQRPDGGMPFICDEDTWVTATAGVALHAAGAPTPVLDAIAGRLLRLQQPGGGWSCTEQAELADVDCTSVAIEVLHAAGPEIHRAPITRALGFLHALRGRDGGFPTYLAGAPSEACMTAAAANALSAQGPRQHATLEAALSHLASQQQPDGTFPPDWSSSRLHTVFRASLAARHHPATPHPAVPPGTSSGAPFDLSRSRRTLTAGGASRTEPTATPSAPPTPSSPSAPTPRPRPPPGAPPTCSPVSALTGPSTASPTRSGRAPSASPFPRSPTLSPSWRSGTSPTT